MSIRTSITTGILALSACLGASAWAGFKANGQVTIYKPARIVDGVPGSARNSADSTQFIGCKVYVPFLGARPEALCLARDTAGNYATCFTDDPAQISVISSIQGDTAIRFIYNDVGGCTHISVERISYYEPKAP